jgi:hypothetical protein
MRIWEDSEGGGNKKDIVPGKRRSGQGTHRQSATGEEIFTQKRGRDGGRETKGQMRMVD